MDGLESSLAIRLAGAGGRKAGKSQSSTLLVSKASLASASGSSGGCITCSPLEIGATSIGRIPLIRVIQGVVLLMHWRGRFMCPFAVAGLGLRYLRISFSVMLGHPLRKLRRTALRRVEIFGLPNNWCANCTALTRVRTDCVNAAIAVGFASCALLGTENWGRTLAQAVAIGNVHKSVDAFLGLTKIICPL